MPVTWVLSGVRGGNGSKPRQRINSCRRAVLSASISSLVAGSGRAALFDLLLQETLHAGGSATQQNAVISQFARYLFERIHPLFLSDHFAERKEGNADRIHQSAK